MMPYNYIAFNSSAMFFWIELPSGACLFLAHNCKTPLFLSGLPTEKMGMFYGKPHALKCTDIRRENGDLQYFVKDYGWLVLRQEDGSALGVWQVPRILQVTLDNNVCIRAGETKTPNAFWTMAENITAETYASAIAPKMFAPDVVARAKKALCPIAPK